MSIELIKNLQKPELYNHPVKYFKLFESHISWVILTGGLVYKIKKPVDFEFLNYSTLEKREFYCHEEIRLNKLLSPEIYVDVVTINGSVENPTINGKGKIIDYAVRMHEFPQDQIFGHLLAEKKLTPELIDRLAKLIAEFHKKTLVAPAATAFGSPTNVHAPVVQNFDQIFTFLTDEKELAVIAGLRKWADEQFHTHHELLQYRKNKGFIRDCHGDLHLGNIIYFNYNKPLLFDRIEFNDEFRWTDVVADIAFLAMDLDDHKQSALSHRLINDYFNATGDYEGLALLPYYLSYRAVVRAKVALFSLSPTNLTEAQCAAIWQHHRDLIRLAQQYMVKKPPALLITHGVTGSAKSSVARLIVEKLAAIQINSDIERKRLFTLPPNAQTNSELNSGIYHPDTTAKTYNRLADIAKIIINAGYPVIIDATFLKQEQREKFYQLAKFLQVPFAILHCQAPRAQVEQWINARKAEKDDPSEAGVEVLTMQEKAIEPLTDHEKKLSINIDTTKIDETVLLEHINRILQNNRAK